jgi:RNA polymerase sigma-70 factor (ECF subfamily)
MGRNAANDTEAAIRGMKDYALIEAFQSGDEFAFVGIYNRYKGPVYAFCLKMLADSAQAQDVMQETFLRIYENRDRLLKTDSFKSWLFTIARNQCLNSLRRSNRHLSFDVAHETAMPSPDTPFSRMEKNEQVRFVTEFLHALKPEYREVIILREYQNLTYEEIAAVTRSTVSAVKSRLFKARKKLGNVMGPLWEDTVEKVPETAERAVPIRRSP